MNVLLIISSVLLNCFAQIFMRKGMLDIGVVELGALLSQLGHMICNFWLWLAMFCYAISIVLWMVVLSKVEVSYAYPFLSIGYVFAAIMGYCLFSENLSVVRMAGIGVICLGVYLISRS